MPSSPDLLSKVDSPRVRNGERTPYHFRNYLNFDEETRPHILTAGKLVSGLLVPSQGISIEGVDYNYNSQHGTEWFSFSLYGDSLPTFISQVFPLRRAVSLEKLLDPEKVTIKESHHRAQGAPLKRYFTIYPDNISPYISRKQALSGEFGESKKPTVFTGMEIQPFQFRKDSTLTGEDTTRAIVTLTTKDTIAYIIEQQHQLRAKWQYNDRNLEDELEAITWQIENLEYQKKEINAEIAQRNKEKQKELQELSWTLQAALRQKHYGTHQET